MESLSIRLDNSSIRNLLQVIGGDIRPTENRASWLYRVSEMTGLSYRKIRAAWYGESITKETAWALRKAAKKNDERLEQRLSRDRQILLEIDPEFYREEIDRLGSIIDRIKALNEKAGAAGIGNTPHRYAASEKGR